MLGGPPIVLGAPKLEGPRGIFPTSLYGHSAPAFNQIDHCLIDGRHFSDVIDIDAMTRMGANIDSDHILVVIKLRARRCRTSYTKPAQLRRFVVDRLKDRDVATRYYDELESELQGVEAQPLSSESSDKHRRLHEKICK
jgi:hypothetical protein